MTSVDDLVADLRSAINRNQIVTTLQRCLVQVLELSSKDPLVNSRYVRLLSAVLDRLSPSFLGCLTKTEVKELFVPIFLDGPLADSFLVLSGSVKLGASPYTIEKITFVLEQFVHTRFDQLFKRFCQIDDSLSLSQIGTTLCQAIVSLPERVANLNQGLSTSSFHTDTYFRRISIGLCSSLRLAHDRIDRGENANLHFASQLLLKCAAAGYGPNTISLLVPWLSEKFDADENDFIWCRISERLLTDVSNQRAAENLVTEAILAAKSKNMDKLFADGLIENSSLKFLVTYKLMLVRSFSSSYLMPEKLVCYFEAARRRRQYISEILIKLLDVWSDAGALIHSSTKQRQYLSHCVLVFAMALKEEERSTLKNEVIQRLLPAMNNGLNCVDITLRQQVLFVGEELTKLFEPEGEPPNFEFDITNPVIEELKNLVEGRNVEEVDDISHSINEMLQEVDSEEKIFEATVYDSDDDLIPYDLPPEEQQRYSDSLKPKPPVYIRDSLDALSEDQDYGKFEAAFSVLESQVRKNAVGFGDIYIELVRRLLHLENRFATDNFELTRLKILVACGVMRPKPVATCLAQEFYAREYTISQRLLILDTICGISRELSDISTSKPEISEPMLPPNEAIPTWRQTVDKRVAAKTRKITVIDKSPKAIPVQNRFAPVACEFFFPLLTQYDQNRFTCLDLLGKDYLVLGRILYTCGTVLHCAENAPIILTMAKSLLEVVWTLRFHEQSFIRQGVIYCFIMIVLVLSPRLLVTEIQQIVTDMAGWLQNVAEKDTNAECQKMATKCMMLLQSRMNDAFKAVMTVE